MSYIFIILFALLLNSFSYGHQNYQQSIHDHAQQWKQTNMQLLGNPTHVQTLIDIILLSYQVAQESCQMIIAKLIIQEELLKIYTPSLIDSWQTNLQVIHNDTSKIEQSLGVIKQSQNNLAILFDKLKSVGPNLLQINPQPTQTMIANLKQGLLTWTMQQDDITDNIDKIQTEFTTAIANIADVKTLFSITLQSPELKKTQLKEAAGCVSKTYKDIEIVFDHFTKIRKTSMYRIKRFFTCFFQNYYTILYDILTPTQQLQLKTVATPSEKLPLPHEFFSDSVIL